MTRLSFLASFTLVALAACSSDVATGDFGGGAAGSGGAGAGADGGAPFTCGSCVPPQAICIDEQACAATCPDGRSACQPSVDPGAPMICCDGGDQCCAAGVNGYIGGDRCHPAGEACPVECPDGATTCTGGAFCALDPVSMTYACAESCEPENVCGGLCCPLGSTCGVDGSCVLADLAIDAEQIVASAFLDTYDFQQGSCSFFEGCVGDIGPRRLLRFDLRTPNIGDGDMLLGNPQGNPLFVYSTCHDHFHFEGYANYRLLDQAMNVVATGHKQAFCLLDWEPYAPDAPEDPKYHCGYQGIQKGWADTYENNLPCQWVDVTGVPPGEYLLEVSLNIHKTLAEKRYDNNLAIVPVTID